MDKYKNFHGLEEAYIVRVVEGEGMPDSVVREVIYVFSTDLCELGKIDCCQTKKPDVSV